MARVGSSQTQLSCLISVFIAMLFTLSTPLAKGQVPRVQSNAPLFAPAVAYDSGGLDARSLAVADVNGDGKPDIVVANGFVDSNYVGGSIGVLLGNGDGTFQPPTLYSLGTKSPMAIAVADLTRDGKPDIVVGFFSGEIGVLLANGNGTFQSAIIYPAGYEVTNLAIADLNHDGKPDVVVATGLDVRVLLGNGDGTFQPSVTYSAGQGPWSVAVADVNGDGDPDVLATDALSGWNTVAVLLGDGEADFSPR